jgi:hypothetical protein
MPNTVFVGAAWQEGGNFTPLLRCFFERSNEDLLLILGEVIGWRLVRKYYSEGLGITVTVGINEDTVLYLVISLLVRCFSFLLHIGLIFLCFTILSFLFDASGLLGLLEHLYKIVLAAELVQSSASTLKSVERRCKGSVNFRSWFHRLLPLQLLLLFSDPIKILTLFTPLTIFICEKLLNLVLYIVFGPQFVLHCIEQVCFVFFVPLNVLPK